MSTEITHPRLINHQIASTKFREPAQVVAHFGAMQGQDYAAARYAVGLRLPEATEAAVEQAVREGTIVRTWALRGTLPAFWGWSWKRVSAWFCGVATVLRSYEF